MILENLQIRRTCTDLFQMFDPLGEALNKMQKADTTIGQAVEVWMDVLEKFPKGANKTFVVDRSQGAFQCPFFLLGNILDHRLKGKRLHVSQRALAMEYAHSFGTEHSEAFTLYLAEIRAFFR